MGKLALDARLRDGRLNALLDLPQREIVLLEHVDVFAVVARVGALALRGQLSKHGPAVLGQTGGHKLIDLALDIAVGHLDAL